MSSKKSDSIRDGKTAEGIPVKEKPDDSVPVPGEQQRDVTRNTTTENDYPEPIRKRINALKVLYRKHLENDSKYYQEILQLEHKYDNVSKEIHEKRREILSGEYEPTEEESNYSSDEVETKEDEADENIHNKKENYPSYDKNGKGIPKFWLTVLKNAPEIRDHVQEYDEEVLSHLEDIKVKLHDSPMGYTLEFHFSENEYFTNKVLTKHYELNTVPPKGKLVSFVGPNVIAFEGCKIDWKEGKSLIEYSFNYLLKKYVDGSLRTLPRRFMKGSFFETFNPFFNPFRHFCVQLPELGTNEEIESKFKEEISKNDFYNSQYLKHTIIPKAFLYYTGDLLSG